MGGTPEGAAASAGLVVVYEAFQGWYPIWWCNPQNCAHLKSSTLSTGYSRSVSHPVWRFAPPAPLAPCDPASGSRTGGALRRPR